MALERFVDVIPADRAGAQRRPLVCRVIPFAASLALAGALATSCTAMPPAAPVMLAGQPCARPPVMKCPEANCGALVTEQGPVAGPAEGRRYFIDYPCDLRPDEKVTVVLSLHGAGSYGNWQRHYFPILDQVDAQRLVVITPNAPPRRWTAEADDAYLETIVTKTISEIGAKSSTGLNASFGYSEALIALVCDASSNV